MSFYADDGSCQSRRLHGMEAEDYQPSPSPAQALQPIIPTFHTQNQSNDIDLLDILPADNHSLATQSFNMNSQVFTRDTVISPVTIAAQQETQSSSSGSVTSVYVQADPPGTIQHGHATSPADSTTTHHQNQSWNTNQPQYELQSATAMNNNETTTMTFNHQHHNAQSIATMQQNQTYKNQANQNCQ